MTKKRVFLSKDKKPRLVLKTKLWIWNFPGNKIISLIAQTSQMDCKLNKNTLTKYLVRALKVVCYLWINFANNLWYERGNYCFNRRFFAVIGKFIPKIFWICLWIIHRFMNCKLDFFFTEPTVVRFSNAICFKISSIL